MTAPIDHVAAAVARLPQQYRADPPTAQQLLLEALVAGVQPLEDALQQVLAGFNVDNATGFALTVGGGLVGRRRNGIADDEMYRRLVRAQILVNSSDGLIEDLITICGLVIYDPAARYVLRNTGAAAFTISVERIAVPISLAVLLIGMLRKATNGGVRCILETSSVAPAATFGFEGSGGLGFADHLGAGGGAWAMAVE